MKSTTHRLPAFILCILAANAAQATPRAYYCQSTCIAVASNAHRVFLLGPVDYVSNASLGEVFRTMNQRCSNRAAEWGLIGITADHVAWSSRQNQEIFDEAGMNESSTHSTSSSHNSATVHYDQIYLSRYDTQSRSFQEIHWSKEEHGLSIDFSPAQPSAACELDPNFDPNQAPYQGDLPFQG